MILIQLREKVYELEKISRWDRVRETALDNLRRSGKTGPLPETQRPSPKYLSPAWAATSDLLEQEDDFDLLPAALADINLDMHSPQDESFTGGSPEGAGRESFDGLGHSASDEAPPISVSLPHLP